jgi:hypothetical protein
MSVLDNGNDDSCCILEDHHETITIGDTTDDDDDEILIMEVKRPSKKMKVSAAPVEIITIDDDDDDDFVNTKTTGKLRLRVLRVFIHEISFQFNTILYPRRFIFKFEFLSDNFPLGSKTNSRTINSFHNIV